MKRGRRSGPDSTVPSSSLWAGRTFRKLHLDFPRRRYSCGGCCDLRPRSTCCRVACGRSRMSSPPGIELGRHTDYEFRALELVCRARRSLHSWASTLSASMLHGLYGLQSVKAPVRGRRPGPWDAQCANCNRLAGCLLRFALRRRAAKSLTCNKQQGSLGFVAW